MPHGPAYHDLDSLPETICQLFIHGDKQYPRVFADAALECLIEAGCIGPANEPGRRFGAGCYVLALAAFYMDFMHIAEASTQPYAWDDWARALDLSYDELRRACVARGNDCPEAPYKDRWCYGDLTMTLSQELRQPLMAALLRGYGARSQLFLALARIYQEGRTASVSHAADDEDDEEDFCFENPLDEQHVIDHWSTVVELAFADRETDSLAAVMAWVHHDCPNFHEQSGYSETDPDNIGLSDAEIEAWLEEDREPVIEDDDSTAPASSDRNEDAACNPASEQLAAQPIATPPRAQPVKSGQSLVNHFSPVFEERFLINPQRQIFKPYLAERLGVVDCATFTCGLSSAVAGRLAITRLRYHDGELTDGPALVLDLFPYADIFPADDDEADTLRTLLHRRDLSGLRRLNAEYVRFYCPGCGMCYAGEHWRFDETFNLDLRRAPGVRYRLNNVPATCPQGHDRTILTEGW